jgi:hypothetical protein
LLLKNREGTGRQDLVWDDSSVPLVPSSVVDSREGVGVVATSGPYQKFSFIGVHE